MEDELQTGSKEAEKNMRCSYHSPSWADGKADSLTVIWDSVEVLSPQCVIKERRDFHGTGKGRVLTGKETL